MFTHQTAIQSCGEVTIAVRPSRSATSNPLGIRSISFSILTGAPILILPILIICLVCAAVAADDKPYDMSANWGGTGLMEIPTARILPDGAMRLGFANADPYRWYSFGFGAFPGLEFTARYTDVTNLPSGLGSDFGSYKDKAFDLKYQLLPESKHVPAIAIGLNDFQGTRLFEAQYLVISRQLYPLDITLGVGRKRLKGQLSIGDEIGFWGGIDWALTDRLHLMLEYNPVEYEKDPLPIKGVPEGSDFPLNVGVRYRTWFGCDLGLSYQRGDTLGFSVHLQFGLGRPILPPKPDPPSWRFAGCLAPATESRIETLQRLTSDVKKAGFDNVSVTLADSELIVEFENNRYPSDTQAAGRVIRLMLAYAQNGDIQLTAVMKRGDLKILRISASSEDLRRFLLGQLAPDQFARSLSVVNAGTVSAMQDFDTAVHYHEKRQAFTYGVDPVLESFFNDPSGVYQSRLTLRPYGTAHLWQGAAIHGSFDIPLYSDIESSNVPPPEAVRSDFWKYLGSETAVNRLVFDQVIKLGPPVFARISAGYLERMYAGVGGEVLAFLDQGRWALGLEGDWVRKREPDDSWTLTDQEKYTLLGNIYYRYLPLDITLKMQVGRFLAGDKGVRLEYRRRFDTGAQIGFWYSITDTHNLTGYNKDYNDQGIFLKLPFAMFTDRPTRRVVHYQISPWTRDVGVTIDHWRNVFDIAADLSPAYFLRNLDEIEK